MTLAAMTLACRQATRRPGVPAPIVDELRYQEKLWSAYAVTHGITEQTVEPSADDADTYLKALVTATAAADHGVRAIGMTCLRRLGNLGFGTAAAPMALPSPLVVTDARPAGRDATRLVLAVPEALRGRFRPLAGQHIAVHADIAGVTIRRNYSVCSPPDSIDDGILTLGVRVQPGGLLSPRLTTAVPGDVLIVSPPSGAMTVMPDPAHRRHVVLLAAGSGVTPLVAAAAALLAGEPRSTVTLVVVERRPEDLMLAADIALLRQRYPDRFAHRLLATRTPHGARPDAADLAATTTELGRAVGGGAFGCCLICGPAAFAAMGRDAAHLLGISPDSIAHESFDPGPSAPARPRRGGRVLITAGDRPHRLDVRPGETLLSAALRTDVPIAFSCLSGSCGTCRLLVLEGDVGPVSPNVLGEPDTAAGWVLACQAAP